MNTDTCKTANSDSPDPYNYPCPDCGAKGDHPDFGPHYWPCGSMKCASIRGDACYQAEIDKLEARIAELEAYIVEITM